MIDIRVYNRDLDVDIEETVDFVSFVTSNTFGAPPLIAPNPKNPEAARAREGQRVAYINPDNIGLLIGERISD